MKRMRLSRALPIALTAGLPLGCFGNPDDRDSATAASTLGATSSPSGDDDGDGADAPADGGDGVDGPADGGDDSSGNGDAADDQSASADTADDTGCGATESLECACGHDVVIGVAECDAYVEQYFECVVTQLPKAVQETSLEALCTSVDAWQRAATTPAGQEGLANACATAYCAVAASCAWPMRDQTAMGCSEPASNCGWGDTGQKTVPDGYVCGGEGEDPGGATPIDCPAGTELVEGGDCGRIGGAGCCDANGDVWYCAEDGGPPMLFTESCQR